MAKHQQHPQEVTPLTNAQCRRITALQQAKHRKREGLFVAEGTKCVLDTMPSFKVEALYALPEWIESHNCPITPTPVSRLDMRRISGLTTPSEVLAVIRIPGATLDTTALKNQLVIALDCVQDPGNLGTIIRLCDWMGVTTILASSDTADCYAPKVVQATMGALARVTVYYCYLAEVLPDLAPVYGLALDGDDIYRSDLTEHGVVLMGNEGNGISAKLIGLITRRLFIPPYPKDRKTSESLNVAIATAITLAEFRRPRD